MRAQGLAMMLYCGQELVVYDPLNGGVRSARAANSQQVSRRSSQIDLRIFQIDLPQRRAFALEGLAGEIVDCREDAAQDLVAVGRGRGVGPAPDQLAGTTADEIELIDMEPLSLC